jgi:nicotinate-nucleotide adenylyltransferase
MVAAAVSTYEHLRVSRIELDRPGISYTVDTLNDFMAFEGLPASDLYYILGSDNLRDFKHWKDPDKILELVTLVVIRRAGFSMPEETVNSHKKIMFLQSPIIEISATEIREKLKSKQDISAIVPAEVEKIIRKNHLYHTG